MATSGRPYSGTNVFLFMARGGSKQKSQERSAWTRVEKFRNAQAVSSNQMFAIFNVWGFGMFLHLCHWPYAVNIGMLSAAWNVVGPSKYHNNGRPFFGTL
ncbi:hypothetical protein BDV35DRAFT_360750 [Aspergillus flavus]|uniref:Uncharacterized protein n=1 Tax=Aspergillus flavus TaxID=5059 RepID=A0A5N6GUN6_ASPFL|nr:hypothetical protein BDV35DRAFT_360750 [Aspergillus flavus]